MACLLIPGFGLRAALFGRPRLALRPAALAPVEGTEPLLGPVTAVAAAAGVRPGVRLGEAPAACPPPLLLGPGPAPAQPGRGGGLRPPQDARLSRQPRA